MDRNNEIMPNENTELQAKKPIYFYPNLKVNHTVDFQDNHCYSPIYFQASDEKLANDFLDVPNPYSTALELGANCYYSVNFAYKNELINYTNYKNFRNICFNYITDILTEQAYRNFAQNINMIFNNGLGKFLYPYLDTETKEDRDQLKLLNYHIYLRNTDAYFRYPYCPNEDPFIDYRSTNRNKFLENQLKRIKNNPSDLILSAHILMMDLIYFASDRYADFISKIVVEKRLDINSLVRAMFKYDNNLDKEEIKVILENPGYIDAYVLSNINSLASVDLDKLSELAEIVAISTIRNYATTNIGYSEKEKELKEIEDNSQQLEYENADNEDPRGKIKIYHFNPENYLKNIKNQ